MKTTTAILLALVAVAAATVVPRTVNHKQVDKDTLVKQKNILDLLIRVQHPTVFKQIRDIANTYTLEEHVADYRATQVAKDVATMYRRGLLMPLQQVFSVLDETRRHESFVMVELLVGAKDYDTFYKTACWMREHINKGQFVFALYTAVMNREDTRDIVLPSLYELYPFLALPTETIQEAQDAKMRGAAQKLVVYVNNSACDGYMCYGNQEHKLAYFREDVGLGDFHGIWHMSQGMRMDGDRRGELFAYTQQQLLARYNLERLSNGMEEVEAVNMYKSIMTGYSPLYRYHNGKQMTFRPAGLHVEEVNTCKNKNICQGKPYISMGDLEIAENRILEAIDTGYVITEKNEKVPITTEQGIAVLGDLMLNTATSVNHKFYGSLYNMIMTFLGRIADPKGYLGAAPSALEHMSTAVKDPLYYQILRRLDALFQQHKASLPKYNKQELLYPGVKIDSVEVDKLVTYFDNFEIDMDNVVPVGNMEEGEHVDIRARVGRINHKPFNYRVALTSDKADSVMVRVFLGPKYDSMGRVMDVQTQRHYMVEIDRFPAMLKTGQNTIERNSQDSTVISKDKISTRVLLKKVQQAIQGGEPFTVDENEGQCGFPERLLIPKGKVSGMPFVFFVMVSPYQEQGNQQLKSFDIKSVAYCGVKKGMAYEDTKPMGYPFDRPIRSVDFPTPNMYFKDVVIYHKKTDDMAM